MSFRGFRFAPNTLFWQRRLPDNPLFPDFPSPLLCPPPGGWQNSVALVPPGVAKPGSATPGEGGKTLLCSPPGGGKTR